MSEPRFRLKPCQGLVEIVTGDRFEIINLANLETIGGNVTHLEEVRQAAIDFAMVEMLATDDEALDDTLEALGYDPDSGELWGRIPGSREIHRTAGFPAERRWTR